MNSEEKIVKFIFWADGDTTNLSVNTSRQHTGHQQLNDNKCQFRSLQEISKVNNEEFNNKK